MAMVLILLPLGAALHCSRDVDLSSEDAGTRVLPPTPPTPDAPEDIPRLDAGLPGSFPLCEARPMQAECTGANDYPCDSERFITNVVARCTLDAGCATGWLALDMGPGGCFEGIGMDEPNESFAACVVEQLGPWRCPCPAGTSVRYLDSTLLPGCQ